MSGAGSSPAGSSPAGFGTPVAASGAPSQAALDSVFIDPVKKDYQYDATGNRVQTTRGRQMVYLAIATVRGSSADPNCGLARAPGVFLDTYQKKRAEDYAAAFKPLEAANAAKLLSVDIQRNGPSQVFERVTWQDLSTLEVFISTI